MGIHFSFCVLVSLPFLIPFGFVFAEIFYFCSSLIHAVDVMRFLIYLILETHADLLYCLSENNSSIDQNFIVIDIGGGTGYIHNYKKNNENERKGFKLATKEFPKDANLFDSLGEAYFTNKQYDLALESYKKAISLGGTNGNAEKMIDKIEKEIGK